MNTVVEWLLTGGLLIGGLLVVLIAACWPRDLPREWYERRSSGGSHE